MKNKFGIIVLVKNKLISLDSIIPILLELKMNHKLSSYIVVSDENAHNNIQKNIVISEVVSFIGKEIYLKEDKSNSFLTKIKKLPSLIKLSLLHHLFGWKVIHFGQLNSNKILQFFFSRKEIVYFSQQDIYKHSWSTLPSLKNKTLQMNSIYGRNIIVFNKELINQRILRENTNQFYCEPTRISPLWVNFCFEREREYIEKYQNSISFKKNFIVYVLAPLIEMPKYIRKNSSLKALFIETIDLLKSFECNVLIKPHPGMGTDFIEETIRNLDNFQITYLHPTLLSKRANCFISNLYSTTQADAYSLGVPTFEYSKYPDKLIEETNGHSIGHEYITMFTQDIRDLEAEILRLSHKNKELILKKEKLITINEDLIENLAN